MSREEFLEEISSIGSLIDFCDDNGCEYIVEDIYYEDTYDEIISEDLYDRARSDGWEEVRDWLSDLPSGYDYYIRCDCDEWSGLDDYDFSNYKEQVLEWAEENGVFDEDEDCDEEECGEKYFDPSSYTEEYLETFDDYQLNSLISIVEFDKSDNNLHSIEF